MNEAKKRITVLVSGEVQEVGYRAFVQRHALDLGLAGYAENLSDGRVEVVAEGVESELKHLLVLLRRGPAHAAVSNLEVVWGEGGKMRYFYAY